MQIADEMRDQSYFPMLVEYVRLKIFNKVNSEEEILKYEPFIVWKKSE